MKKLLNFFQKLLVEPIIHNLSFINTFRMLLEKQFKYFNVNHKSKFLDEFYKMYLLF